MDDLLERNGIVGECLFSDHISHEHDQELVGQALGRFPELRDLFGPILPGEVGQKIGRLPGFIHRQEEGNVLACELLQTIDHSHVGIRLMNSVSFCVNCTIQE